MKTEKEIREEIAALSGQIAPLQDQMRKLQESRKQAVLSRIEEIRLEVVKLVEEAGTLTREAGIPFYRDSFLEGIDGNARYWGDADHYWQASDINC